MEALFQAVRDGNVREALERAQPLRLLNRRDRHGWTVLHIAAMQHNAGMVRALIRHGARQMPDRQGIVPASLFPDGPFQAETEVDLDFADLLITRRNTCRIHRFSPGAAGRSLLAEMGRVADLDHWSLVASGRVDATSVLPIHLFMACRCGPVDAVTALVHRYGIKPNHTLFFGWTPLHVAVLFGRDDEIVEALQSFGAVFAPTDDGVVPTDLVAADNRDSQSMTTLERAIDTIATGMHVWSSSRLATTICSSVRRFGVPILTDNMSTPYSIAAMLARGGHVTACRLCLEFGVDVDTAPIDGRRDTMLALACDVNRVHVARLLLMQGAATETIAVENDTTPLIAAMRHQSREMFRLVLNYGADVDFVNEEGMTPMAYAAVTGADVFYMDLLWAAGTDLEHCTSLDRTAFRLAIEQEHLEQARFLKDRGADIDSVDARGWTPLLYNCAVSYPGEMMRAFHFLLDVGADVNKQDGRGRTPMHHAAQSQDDRRLVELLKHGADPFVVDEFERKPAEMFVRDTRRAIVLADILSHVDSDRARTIRMLESLVSSSSSSSSSS